MEEKIQVVLTDAQVWSLLALIDNAIDDTPDNFWDKEKQDTIHWEGNEQIHVPLQEILDKYLCEAYQAQRRKAWRAIER